MWEKFGWKGKSLKTLPTKSKMLLLLLVGLLLLVIAFPDGSSKQKSGQIQTEDGTSGSWRKSWRKPWNEWRAWAR